MRKLLFNLIVMHENEFMIHLANREIKLIKIEASRTREGKEAEEKI